MDTCLIASDLPLNNVSTSATVYLQMILMNYASSAIIEAVSDEPLCFMELISVIKKKIMC